MYMYVYMYMHMYIVIRVYFRGVPKAPPLESVCPPPHGNWLSLYLMWDCPLPPLEVCCYVFAPS
jgi:hypothetical protein